jgi:hydroxyacylglutathione hydrolase
MRVVPVPVREDNYAYLIIDDKTKHAAAVDPYDVSKVKAAATAEGVEIVAGITTHHHHDHSGGNQEFARVYSGVKIYGGSNSVPALTNLVKDGDSFKIGENIDVKCLATPCHTQDSICYHIKDGEQQGVFTGDTLFQAGCGRFFEGDGEQMHAALTKLATLPDSTIVYNGHEYTKASAAFGAHVDPDNQAIKRLQKLQSENVITTGKTTIGDEKEWNVFMRLDSPAVLAATELKDPIEVMSKLRTMKNEFRG